jgi:hypothetical protein
MTSIKVSLNRLFDVKKRKDTRKYCRVRKLDSRMNRENFKPVKGGFYDPKELARGAKIELEHVYDDYTARIIAKHHLDEDRNYYKKLLKYVEPRRKSK